MAQDCNTPQYLALQKKYDAVCSAMESSGGVVVRVARKLRTRNLIDKNVEAEAFNAVDAGKNLTVVVSQLLQAVDSKIAFSWESFYDLVDVLNECELQLPTAIGRILEQECERRGGQRPETSASPHQTYLPQPSPQQPYPAPQQSYTAPQQSYTAPQQPYPAPQQSYTAPQQSYTAPQQPSQAPQQPYPAPQQSYTAPQQPYPAPQQSYTAPQQSYTAPQQPSQAPQQPYPAPQQSYTAPQQPYAAPHGQQPYPAPQQPYAAPQQPYPAPQQLYPASQQPYPAPQQPCPAPQQPCPAPQQLYPASQQPYPAPQQPCPAPQQPFPAPQQPCPAPQQPYLTPQQPYPSQATPQQPHLSSSTGVGGASADPLFTEYMTRLEDVYKDPPRPWGPLPECELIKLAMIKGEQFGGPDGSIDLHGINISIEKKMVGKVPVEMDELFDHGTFDKDRKVILVEGAPGMGKTMLSHHYCQKWAAGELSMFDAVILVPLRELDVQSDSSLANLLLIASAEHVIETTNEMAEHVTSLLKNVKILFIFDGWDEFPVACKDQKRSCVWRIINKPQSVSPQTTILITSRPDSSLDLHKQANRVEILGFTEDNIHEYFRKALQHKFSPDKVESGFSKLRDHIDDYPVIKSSCYVPLNTAILVHVFCEYRQALPKTRYELFRDLVLCNINRERGTRPNVRDVEGVSSLEDPNVKDQLSHICKLAYEGVMQNKAVFKREEFSAYNLPTHISTLGLLQCVEQFNLYGCRTFSYYFLHLSIQELFTAHHISQMEEGEQAKMFESLLGEPRFSAVLQFYAAFTKLTNQGVQNIITKSGFTDQRHRLLLLLNCFFEAQLQDQSLYYQIISNLNSKLDLQHITLSPVDCMSVGYFLAGLPMTTGELTVDLSKCSITAHSMSLLLGELSRHADTSAGVLQGIVSLDISGNDIGDSANSPLQKLTIRDVDIGDSGIVGIATALKKCNTLKELNISKCGITEVEMKSFVETIKANSSLQQLFLSSYQFKMGLKRNGTLTVVVIKEHDLSTEGVVSIAETLIANSPLQELTIRYVNTGDSGIAGIATALKKCNTLKELDISECGMTEVGVVSLAQALAVNRSLKKLIVSENNIGDNGIVYIAKALERNSTLEELGVSLCGMTEVGVASLAETLAVNSSLKKLIASVNNIGDNGIVHIAKALKRNSTLEELGIGKCGITEMGVELLAEALPVNHSLERLVLDWSSTHPDQTLRKLAECVKRSALKELHLTTLTKGQLIEEEVRELSRSLEMGGKEFIQSQEGGDLRKLTLNLFSNWLWWIYPQQRSQAHESFKASASLVNSARRERGRPPIDVVIM